MFRAEIMWLANGLTLKMEGRLVAEWAKQARCLVTADVVPKGLIVDLTEVHYIDSRRVFSELVGQCGCSVCRQKCLRNRRMRTAAFIPCRGYTGVAWE
jgi:hypothetical protein